MIFDSGTRLDFSAAVCGGSAVDAFGPAVRVGCADEPQKAWESRASVTRLVSAPDRRHQTSNPRSRIESNPNHNPIPVRKRGRALCRKSRFAVAATCARLLFPRAFTHPTRDCHGWVCGGNWWVSEPEVRSGGGYGRRFQLRNEADYWWAVEERRKRYGSLEPTLLSAPILYPRPVNS